MAMQQTGTAVLVWAVVFAAGAGALAAQEDTEDAPVAVAAPEPEPEPFTMNLAARLQTRYTYTRLEDDDGAGSFGIRRARLAASGRAYGYFDYAIQAEFAGGSARLLDANVVLPLGELASLWIGQGKAPFSRQQLTSSTRLQFVDRAITDARFAAGRQQGIAVQGRIQTFAWIAGVYNGNGINQANDNDSYLQVARVVWTPWGDVPLAESALTRPSSLRWALGLAGMRNTVSGDDVAADIRRLGAEAVLLLRGFSAAAELYLERTTQAGDRFDTRGWYAQAGYLFVGDHEVALRAATIQPRPSSLDSDITEYAAAYSYYLRGHNAKVQADVRRIRPEADDAATTEFRVQLQIAS